MVVWNLQSGACSNCFRLIDTSKGANAKQNTSSWQISQFMCVRGLKSFRLHVYAQIFPIFTYFVISEKCVIWHEKKNKKIIIFFMISKWKRWQMLICVIISFTFLVYTSIIFLNYKSFPFHTNKGVFELHQIGLIKDELLTHSWMNNTFCSMPSTCKCKGQGNCSKLKRTFWGNVEDICEYVLMG